MKNKTLKAGVRMMLVSSVLFIATGIVAAQTADSADNASTEAAMKMIGAGLALGLTGYRYRYEPRTNWRSSRRHVGRGQGPIHPRADFHCVA